MIYSAIFTHLANAIRYPRAMMIKLLNTPITSGTMLRTKRSNNLIEVQYKMALEKSEKPNINTFFWLINIS